MSVPLGIEPPAAPLLHIASDSGAGPPVVVLHGIASSSASLAYLTPLIAARHRTLLIDLLGFGSSPAPADACYTLDDHVDALERTLSSISIDRFSLIGHSLGALIGARYAARYPERIRGLVLVSPPIYLDPADVRDPVERMIMSAHIKVSVLARRHKGITTRAARALARTAPVRGIVNVSETTWRAFSLSLKHAVESRTTLTDLAELSIPVHVVYGTRDALLPVAGIRTLSESGAGRIRPVVGGRHGIRPATARAIAEELAIAEQREPPTQSPRRGSSR